MRQHVGCALGALGLALVAAEPLRADAIGDILQEATVAEYQSYMSVLTGVDPLPGETPIYLMNRQSYTPQARLAAIYLKDRFAALGLQTKMHPFDPVYAPNVVAELPGTTRPQDIYIVCAHFDDWSIGAWGDADTLAPGADDNASGVAAVLLAARILSQYQFEGTIRFIAFSAEEEGLIGSSAYAAAAADAGENIRAVINFDMILHPAFDDEEPDPDYDLDIGADGPSAPLAQLVAAQFALYTPLNVQVHTDGVGSSDQAAFWWEGYSAVGLLENTAYEIWGGSNAAYHTRHDNMSHSDLDWPFGLEVVRGGMASVLDLAGLQPGQRSSTVALIPAAAAPRPARRAIDPVSDRGLSIYVDDDAAAGGDGTSWQTAFRYLQDGLASAVEGSVIRIAQGTYRPDQDETGVVVPGDPAASFHLADWVTIAGGYRGCPGGHCASPDARDPDLYPTILSGDLLGDDDPNFAHTDDNAVHVATVAPGANYAALSGCTVRAGNSGTAAVAGGAAVFVENASPQFLNCTFTQNSGCGAGAVFCTGGGTPEFSACKFTENQGSGVGSASGSDPRLTDCELLANTMFGFYGQGGSDPVLSGCVLDNNRASGIASAGAAVIADCVITRNGFGDVAPVGWGGGISCSGGGASLVTGCTITSNTARQEGGGVSCVSVCIVDSVLASNSANESAGISSDAGLTVENCTLSWNWAGWDGGAILSLNYADIASCYIGGNQAATWSGWVGGGALYVGAGAAIAADGETSP